MRQHFFQSAVACAAGFCILFFFFLTLSDLFVVLHLLVVAHNARLGTQYLLVLKSQIHQWLVNCGIILPNISSRGMLALVHEHFANNVLQI